MQRCEHSEARLFSGFTLELG